MTGQTKKILRRVIPTPILQVRRRVLDYYKTDFALTRWKWSPSSEKRQIASRLRSIHEHVPCEHTHAEMIRMVEAILSIRRDVKGCLVEAGCYKGGSTAKLSILAKLLGRQLVVFDSFQGIPENAEAHHHNIFGGTVTFPKGSYEGGLAEARANVERHGELDCCRFVPGWFDDTMPGFHEPVVAAFVDVDLASSTRTCLQYLYPLLVPGGFLFSHDGHLPLCLEVFNDESLWRSMGVERPYIEGLGQKKLIRVWKPER
jgi:O-methyltransferase